MNYKNSKVLISEDGKYNEVDINTGKSVTLEKAQISLKDCLACSGCITSAETVLVQQQSVAEFFSILNETDKLVVVSISPQTRASIASHFNITLAEAQKRLVLLFNKIGIKYVYDSSFSRDFSLLESREEFVEKYKKSQEEKQQKKTTQKLYLWRNEWKNKFFFKYYKG